MEMNAPTKCPRCGSQKPELHPAMQFEGEVEICTHPGHRERAAPPEGETMHFPIDKTDAYDERVDRERQEAVASPAISAVSVQEVRRDDQPPSCHVCGTTMMKAFHCNSCGANTWPISAAPPAAHPAPWVKEVASCEAPAGMTAEQIAVELCADLVNTDPLLYCPATVRKITQRIEAYAAQLHGEVARLTREARSWRNVAERLEDEKQQAEAELARLREQVPKVRAAQTAWLDEHGVPISFTFAEFAKTLGELLELIEARAALESTTPQEGK